MKVYVVKEPTGAYEDYKEIIIGVYSDYSIVEKLINKQNKKIEHQRNSINKCRACKFNKVPIDFVDEIKKPKCFNAFEHNYLSEIEHIYCKCNGLRNYEGGDICNYYDTLEDLMVEEFDLDKEN